MKSTATNLKLLIYTEYFFPVIGGVQTSVALLARGLANVPPQILPAVNKSKSPW